MQNVLKCDLPIGGRLVTVFDRTCLLPLQVG